MGTIPFIPQDVRRRLDAGQEGRCVTLPFPATASAPFPAPPIRGKLRAMDLTELAFTHAPIGLTLSEERILRQSNPRFCEMFATDAATLKDISFAQLYPSSELSERTGAQVRARMRKTGRYQDERIMRRLNGELFWCRVRGQSLSPDDPFQRAVWSFVDLSDERPVVALTPREREIAMLTCQGLTSKEIGRQLEVSYRTVEAHRARLLQKFGARKLPELVAKLSGMPL